MSITVGTEDDLPKHRLTFAYKDNAHLTPGVQDALSKLDPY